MSSSQPSTAALLSPSGEAAPAGEQPPANGRSPRTDWPWWSAGLALATALLLAAIGLLLVDVPAALVGVNLSASPTPPGIELADTVVQDAAFVIAVLVIAGMGGRLIRPWQFGLQTTSPARAAGLVALLYVSFLILSAIWATVMHLHGKEKLLQQLGANNGTALLLGSALLTCVIAPICEEFLFRGYIFTALRSRSGVLTASVVTGVIFGAVHAASAPAAYLVPLAFLGFALCLLYWRTGSLLPCIAAHSLNNSIAFGSLENWNLDRIAALAAGSLTVLALIAFVLRRKGLIVSATGGHTGAHPAPVAA